MATANQKLTVEIWSDVICPWCWIGLTRFEKALGAFQHRDHVDVVHHAFRLMPGAAPRAVREVLAERMGIPQSSVPDALRQVEETAASEGLAYRLTGTSTGDTIEAHRLIKLAATKGKSHEMLVRLYRAYMSEGKSVFERDSLAALAMDAGIERDEASALLHGDAFREEVERDQKALRRLGGNGVPFFLIGGKYGVSGAQSVEVFARALSQGWADLPEPPILMGEGTACGPDGCAVS